MAAAVESISWTVGNNVKLRTAQGEEVSGQVFAYDQPSSLLVLKEVGAHSGVNNIRIIKTSGVQAVISDAKPDLPFDMELPAVDLERCRKREEKALQQAEFDSSRVGEGVTKEAQAIFESLAKTMPCVWRGKVRSWILGGRGGRRELRGAACLTQWVADRCTVVSRWPGGTRKRRKPGVVVPARGQWECATCELGIRPAADAPGAR